MPINMNELFSKLNNFKIKFTKKPSPVEISNMDIFFTTTGEDKYYSDVLDISVDHEAEQVLILLGEKEEK